MKLRIDLEPENPIHRDIHSYSVDRSLHSLDGLNPRSLRSLAHDIVGSVAHGCEAAGAKDVSHVKLYLEHSSGFLHAHFVSGNRDITIGGRDGATAQHSFRVVLNAVIFGLSEEDIKQAAERALEAVQDRYTLIRTARS